MNFYTSVERWGNNILWRGYENGRRFIRKEKFEPTLYIRTKDESSKYRAFIDDIPLAPKKFDTMKDSREFIEKYKDVHGITVYGNSNYVAQFIQEKYPTNIKYDYDKINIFMFDIEVDISDGFANINEADKPITAIALKSSKRKEYHLLGLKDYDKTKTITGIDPDKIIFERFDSEILLLKRFIELWINDYPDVVSGWNVEYFDVMYTVTRIIRLFGEDKAKTLSPFGKLDKFTNTIMGRDQSSYKISGISVVDYMDCFKKFGYKYGPQESYKLDHIAHVVLGEKKLDYSEYGTLSKLYEDNPQLFLDYCLKDTRLIEMMEEVTSLISLVMTVAYSGGVNYTEAFGTVGIWDTTIYRKLMSRNIVPAVKGGPGDQLGELVGGYVKPPIPGMYKWIVSCDLNSLYPHLMLQYNLSPETYIKGERDFVNADMILNKEYQNKTDHVVAANGSMYRKDIRGIIPEIIEEYYTNRKKIKQEMLKVENEIEQIKEEIARRKTNHDNL